MAHCATLTIDPFILPPLRSTQHCPRLAHTTSLPQSAHRLSIGTRSPFSVFTLHPPLASAPLLLVFAVHSPSCLRPYFVHYITAVSPSPSASQVSGMDTAAVPNTPPFPWQGSGIRPHSPLSQSPFHTSALPTGPSAPQMSLPHPKMLPPPHPGYTQRKV